ncbi:MAG: SURF1 family protein [bacterium]|nr:SURF1 family protein [bacterium]
MRSLIRPRWIIFSALVTLVAIACIFLGFWQLGRLEQRRELNTILDTRLSREAVPIEDLIAALQPRQGMAVDPDDYEHTRITAQGRLLDQGRVLVRSQVVDSQAGFHAVYPMDLGDGQAVLVNVGWIPLSYQPETIEKVYGQSGHIELTGLVRADQKRPTLGREEPPGYLETVARIDIDRIQQQVDLPLHPFWIQLIEPNDPGRFPIPPDLPEITEGPHLSYAVQWFSFGAIALIGYAALIRREIKTGPRRPSQE